MLFYIRTSPCGIGPYSVKTTICHFPVMTVLSVNKVLLLMKNQNCFEALFILISSPFSVATLLLLLFISPLHSSFLFSPISCSSSSFSTSCFAAHLYTSSPFQTLYSTRFSHCTFSSVFLFHSFSCSLYCVSFSLSDLRGYGFSSR